MPDKEILKLAILEKRLVVTMDKDFGELVYNSKMSHAGVLLLRLGDATSSEKVKVVKIILEKFCKKIRNKFSVFKNGKLRVKK